MVSLILECKKVHHAPFSESLFDSFGCYSSYLWIGSGVHIFVLVWGPSKTVIATFSKFCNSLQSCWHFFTSICQQFQGILSPLTLPKSLLWMKPCYSKMFYDYNSRVFLPCQLIFWQFLSIIQLLIVNIYFSYMIFSID